MALNEMTIVVLNDPNEMTTNVEVPKRRLRRLRTYFSKWTGQHMTASPPPAILSDCIITFIGTFLGVGILGAIHYRLLVTYDMAFFIASFGATATLLYGLPSSPLAQPRNVIGGQVISAIVGCTVRLLVDTRGETFVPIALSVCVTLFLMQVTNTMHAPAGATAVIAVTTSSSFAWAGFQFVLVPVLSNSLILVFVAVVINNLVSNRHYPCRWW